MSLLQLEYDVMPFTFADILILRYLLGVVDEFQTLNDFDKINSASDLRWSLKSQIVKFIKRFLKDPYKEEDKEWIQKLLAGKNIKVKKKFAVLSKLI